MLAVYSWREDTAHDMVLSYCVMVCGAADGGFCLHSSGNFVFQNMERLKQALSLINRMWFSPVDDSQLLHVCFKVFYVVTQIFYEFVCNFNFCNNYNIFCCMDCNLVRSFCTSRFILNVSFKWMWPFWIMVCQFMRLCVYLRKKPVASRNVVNMRMWCVVFFKTMEKVTSVLLQVVPLSRSYVVKFTEGLFLLKK